MPNYKIQTSRGGEAWQDYQADDISIQLSDVPKLNTLEFWIGLADELDTYDGKYQIRIIDESTQCAVYQAVEPYDPARIDIKGNSQVWMDRIRRGYGIEINLWKEACKEWLKKYEDPSVM